jgi:hypothetical protein
MFLSLLEPKNLVPNNEIVESTIFSFKDTVKKYLPIIKTKYVGEIEMINNLMSDSHVCFLLD